MIKTQKNKLTINSQGAIALSIALFIGFLFPETAQSYINTWLKFDESMGHALIIIAIVVFFLLKPNHTPCNQHTNKTHWLLILPIFLLIISHQVSTFWGILIFQQFSLYFLWLLAIYFILGKKYFKQNIFPLLFFLFAVPFWEFLNPIFLHLTTIAVTYLLDFTPVVAFMDGNLIELPYGMLEIAGGCSGLRYFEIGLALSVFAVYSENLSKRLKLLVIVVGVGLGIITNWIRVLSLIYIGYESKMTSELIYDHETFGLILFMLVITPLIFFINWLSANHGLSVKKETIVPKENQEKINNTSWTFLAFFIVGTLCAVWLVNVDTTNQDNPNLNQSKATHPLLNSYGNYTQTVKTYTQDKKCNAIIRNYRFLEAGKNSLPLKQLYNSDDFYAITTNIKELPKSKNKAKHIILTNKTTQRKTELYYWYKYDNFKIKNNYLAKLAEIVFLIDDKNEISLNIITCPVPS